MDRKTSLFERASALIVAVAMLFSMMPVQVFAEGKAENEPAAVITEEEPAAASVPQTTETKQKEVSAQSGSTQPAQSGSTQPSQSGDTQPAQAGSTQPAQAGSTQPAQSGSTQPAQAGSTQPSQSGDTQPAQSGDTQSPQGEENQPVLYATDVTGVTLSAATLDMEIGDTELLTAVVEPQDADQTLEWASSAPDIADVADGTVTAKAAGQAQITVTATNGTADPLDDQTAVCTVTVTLKNVNLEVTGGDPITYGEPYQVSATVNVAGTLTIQGVTQPLTAGANTVEIPGLTVGTTELDYSFTPDDAAYAAVSDGKLSGVQVNPKPLTVANWTIANNEKEYDGTNEFPVASVTLAGKVAESDDVQVDLTSVYGEAAQADAGTTTVSLKGRNNNLPTLTGAAAGNYTVSLDGAQTITATITPCPVTLQAIILPEKTYDGTTDLSADGAVYTFVKANDTATAVPGISAEGLSFQLTDADAGDAKAVTVNTGDDTSLVGEGVDNYDWQVDDTQIQALGVTVKVNPCPVTIALTEGLNKTSDGTNAVVQQPGEIALTVTCNLQDVTASVVDTANWTYANTVPSTESYAITGMQSDDIALQRGGAAELSSNYAITFDNFTGMINPASITEGQDVVDLTAENANQLTLENGVTVSFAQAGHQGTDGRWWFAAQEQTLASPDGTSFFAYGDAPTTLTMSNTVSGATNTFTNVYLQMNDTGKVYGPITIQYAYDDEKPTFEVDENGVQFVTGDQIQGDANGAWVEYALKVTEEGSGVREVQYYVTTASADEVNIQDGDWQTSALEDGKFHVTVPAKGYVYVRATDLTGNVSDVTQFHPLVVEQEKPTISLTLDENQPENWKSSKQHTLSYLVQDGGDKTSGLASVRFELWKDGVQLSDEDAKAVTDANVTHEAPATLGEIDALCKVEGTLTLKDNVPDGTYIIKVFATDFCGNPATAETTPFVIDNTAPSATVSMAKTQPASDGNYYYKASDAQVAIAISDANSADSLSYSITVDDKPVQSGDLLQDDTIELDANVLGALDDGTHTLTLQMQDHAGNQSTAENVTFVGMRKTDAQPTPGAAADVVIDNTVPTVALAVPGANEVDGVYYVNATNCDISVVVTDNFAGALQEDAAYNVTVSDPNSPVSVADGELSADSATRTFTLTSEQIRVLQNGEKTITVTAVDAAGNRAEKFTSVTNAAYVDPSMSATINLDTYAPQLTNVVSTDGHLYDEGIYYTFNQGNQIVVTYTITDDPANNNYYNNDSYRAVTVTRNGQADTDVAVAYGDDGVITATIPIRENVSRDVYHLEITAQDKAKNLLVLQAGIELGDRDVQSDTGTGTITGTVDKIVDTVAPTAQISYTPLDATHFYAENGENGPFTAYYNKTLDVQVALYDAGSLDDSKIWYARSFEGAQDAYAHFADLKGTDNTAPVYSGGKLTVEATTENNGTYTYALYGEDKAGNPLAVTESDYYGAGVPRSQVPNCGSSDTAYLTAPKAIDTVAPTATIDYTALEDTHYYSEGDVQVNAYYNHDFTANFSYADSYGKDGKSYGLDAAKIHYTQNLTDAKDQTLGDAKDQPAMTAAYNVTGAADDAHYTFGAYGEDKAGNPLVVTEYRTANGAASQTYTAASADACQLNYHKVLDTVAPTFTLSVNDPANDLSIAVDSENRAYYNGDIQASFTVNDANLDLDKVKMATTSQAGTDFAYDTADVSWTSIVLGKADSVTADTTTTLTDTASRDGIYRFQIEGEDRAGNRLVQSAEEAAETDFRATLPLEAGQFWTYLKVRDTLAPTLDVELSDTELFYKARLGEMTQQDNTYYNLQVNKPYRASSNATGTLTKTDCSPTSVEYEIASTTASQSEPGSAYSHENLGLTIGGEQVFTIAKLVIKDRAGNVSTMPKESNKIYLDVAAPDVDELVPTVSIVAEQSGEGNSVGGQDLFSGPVNVRATVTDPGEGVRSSGLYHVYYQVLVNDADWTDRVSVSGKGSVAAAGVIGYGTTGKEYESLDAVDEPITSQDVIDFGFDADTFNYNDVKIYVWAEDNSGNVLTQSEAAHYFFGIDVTTPTIEVRYDNNDAQNEKYFKDDRTATVTVTERNFDPSQTVITTESHEISSWSYQAGSMPNGDDDKWVATVAYTQDGDYTFDVTTADLVGHKAEAADYGDSVAPREFTIDKTIPIIDITFDNNDVQNGKYYNQTRTATVSVEEHNFSTDGVTLSTTANVQEGSVAAPGAGGWSSGGDMNTATVPFTQDGNYTMHVEYVDLAGNEAEPQDVDEFVVDTTAPDLTFSINGQAFDEATYEPQAYNGEVIPSISYHDINYDADGTQMSIVGAKNKDSQILTGAPAEDAMGGVYTCENIEQTPENDDVYTCTGRVVDMAGNESTVDFVFSVNRYGSNYLLGDATQKLVDNYYTNQAPTLDVTEINVNTLKFNEITYALNGEIQTLSPDTDYSVAESGSATSWKQYDYTIFDTNFQQEGAYDITISSEDEAGNLNSNHTERVKEYSKNISFVLDQTAPSITISGVEEDGRYDSDTRSISINYSENFAMDTLTVTNGEKSETYTADQLEATSGILEFEVPASNDRQVVTVTATDKAGNSVSTESPRFLLTSNKLIQFINNTPLLVGSIVVLLLILAAIVDYLRKGFLYALLHKKAADKQ